MSFRSSMGFWQTQQGSDEASSDTPSAPPAQSFRPPPASTAPPSHEFRSKTRTHGDLPPTPTAGPSRALPSAPAGGPSRAGRSLPPRPTTMIEGGPQRTLPPTPGASRGGSTRGPSPNRGGARPPPRGRALPAPPPGGPTRAPAARGRPQSQIYSSPTQSRANQALPTPPTKNTPSPTPATPPGYMAGLSTGASAVTTSSSGPTRASEPPRGRVMQRLSMFEQGATNSPVEEEPPTATPVSVSVPSYARASSLPTPPPKVTPRSEPETSYGYGEGDGASYGYGDDGATYGDGDEGQEDEPSSTVSSYAGQDEGAGYGEVYGDDDDDGGSYGAAYGEGATYDDDPEEDYAPSYPVASTPAPPTTPSTPGYLQGVTHTSAATPMAPAPAKKKKPPPVPPPKPQELSEPPEVERVVAPPVSVRQHEAVPHPPPRSPRRLGVRAMGSPPPLPWREDEDLGYAPHPPPRSPDNKRRAPAGPSPPLPSREPLPTPDATPSLPATASHTAPPSLSTPPSTASPTAKPTRAKKEKAKGGGGRLSSFFRRSWYGNADAEQVAKADRERAQQRAGEDETPLPTFGLTVAHLQMDGKQQADVLSSQMNEINDKIATLLQERRSKESDPEELARVDRQVRHYNNQLDVVSSELSTVNQRISSETAATPASVMMVPETDSPHLSRRPNLGPLKGVRQERRQASVDMVTEHKLKLAYGRGDVITVVEKFPTGWWKGELRGVIAYFQEKNTLPVEGLEDDSSEDSSFSSSATPVSAPMTIQQQPQGSGSGGYGASTSALPQPTTLQQQQPQATSIPLVKQQVSSPSPVSASASAPTGQQTQPQQQQQQRVAATASSSSSSAGGSSQALALYSFEKQNATEVGMSKGETVSVVKVMDAWTYISSSQGSGYVPTSYLKF